MNYFIKGFFKYSVLYILCVMVLSVIYFYCFSTNDYIHKIGLRYSFLKGIYVYWLGGELLVLALLGYAVLLRRAKSLLSIGIFWNTLIFLLLVVLLGSLFIEFNLLNKQSSFLDTLNVIHVNGWSEVTAFIVGSVIYFLEVKPVFK